MGRVLPLLLCATACETRLVLVDPPPGSCTPTNCTGCCDSHNTCIAGATQSDTQCGEKGSSCFQCASGTHCTNGKCVAPPTCGPCVGCCTPLLCDTGNEDIACGKDGEMCNTCVNNDHCVDGKCIACNPGTCPDGCCNFFGECVSGTGDNDCGTGGIVCKRCMLLSCIGGTCR